MRFKLGLSGSILAIMGVATAGIFEVIDNASMIALIALLAGMLPITCGVARRERAA